MRETGKRSRHQRDNYNEGNQHKKRFSDRDISGGGELVVYRILCPDNIVGSVIGKGGKIINRIRQETNSKIKIVDPFPGADKRVITIYCYVRNKDPMDVNEDDLEPQCPAQDALLRMHDAIVDALENANEIEKKNDDEAHILVPASQAATIIGKSGVTIKKLRSKFRVNIKINPKTTDAKDSCAMSFDNFLQITGDSEAVKKALAAVSAIMYKFPPKEEISLDTSVPELPPSIIIPSDVPIIPAGSFYPTVDSLVQSSRSMPPIVAATSHASEFHGLTDTSNTWQLYPSALPVVSGYNSSAHSEDLVIRVLCPSDKIGRVIGKGGSTVKNIRQSSGAKIDVDDAKDKSEECVITITSTESTDDVKSAAVEAVLLLQGKINDDDDDKVNIRLLVPSKVIGCLIGKSGSIINDMRKKTKADIRISKGEKPKRAASTDELVEVAGEVGNVRDALVQITLRLREDALRDRDGNQNSHADSSQNAPSIDPLYGVNMSVPPILSTIPPVASLSYDQRVETERNLGVLTGSSLYGYSALQAGDTGYGSFSSYSSKTYGRSPAHVEVVIPANASAKIIGKGGSNLDSLSKMSGAHIEIVDSKSSPFERIAQISGTPEQKRLAENLIQVLLSSG